MGLRRAIEHLSRLQLLNKVLWIKRTEGDSISHLGLNDGNVRYLWLSNEL